jgi:hypothetical protein
MTKTYLVNTLVTSIIAKHGHPAEEGIRVRGAELMRYTYLVSSNVSIVAEQSGLVSYTAVSQKREEGYGYEWKVERYHPI